MLKSNRVKSQAGFSLIELMIVVAIIGVLAAIAVPNFQKFQAKAKQSESKGHLAAIFTGEKSYRAEWDTYTGCMDHAGFDIDGAATARYNAGITGGTTVSPRDTVAGCVPVRTGAAGGENPTGNAAVDAAATTFTAGARSAAGSILSGAANADEWHIDQNKLVTQISNGLE